jgi:hypothetical protein
MQGGECEGWACLGRVVTDGGDAAAWGARGSDVM